MKIRFYSPVMAVLDYTGCGFLEYNAYFKKELIDKYDDGLISYLQPEDLINYVKQINKAIRLRWFYIDEQDVLMKHFHLYNDSELEKSILNKIKKVMPKIVIVAEKAYAVMECKVRAELSNDEIGILKRYFEAEYLGDWGELLEEYAMNTNDGAMYISFRGDDFFIDTEQEFQKRIEISQDINDMEMKY